MEGKRHDLLDAENVPGIEAMMEVCAKMAEKVKKQHDAASCKLRDRLHEDAARAFEAGSICRPGRLSS